MLWHPRCRWPARLSLPPTPRHGPRKHATRLFPVVQGESATLDAFYDKIWMGHIYWSCYLNATAKAVASTSRPRCSHSRMKAHDRGVPLADLPAPPTYSHLDTHWRPVSPIKECSFLRR